MPMPPARPVNLVAVFSTEVENEGPEPAQVEILRHSWDEDGADMVGHFSGTDVDSSTAAGCSKEVPIM